MRAETGDLRLLVHPGWSRVVQPMDHDYIRAILSDFKRRAKFDPEGLMSQVSELSVGPLVTHAVGARLSEHPFLLFLGKSFVEPHFSESD